MAFCAVGNTEPRLVGLLTTLCAQSCFTQVEGTERPVQWNHQSLHTQAAVSFPDIARPLPPQQSLCCYWTVSRLVLVLQLDLDPNSQALANGLPSFSLGFGPIGDPVVVGSSYPFSGLQHKYNQSWCFQECICLCLCLLGSSYLQRTLCALPHLNNIVKIHFFLTGG